MKTSKHITSFQERKQNFGIKISRQMLCDAVPVLHDLGTSLDARDEIYVVYLDFSKAFDPHGRLLRKLSPTQAITYKLPRS